MKRAIILSLVILFSIGAMLPFATDWSEASKTRVHKHKKYKKYSRAWWRQYRARVRRNRALAARRQELAALRGEKSKGRSARIVPVSQKNQSGAATQLVAGWSSEAAGTNGAQAKYRVSDTSGRAIGSAQLSVVGAAMPQAENEQISAKARSQMLAGVSVSALRRTVIDSMIREQGWIVNDYVREMNGKKVFVVVAQSNQNGATKSRLFYFTEANGRIYNLATTAPSDYSDKIAADSEQFIQKLQRSSSPQTQDVTASSSFR